VRACVRACVHACVRACVCACVRACVRALGEKCVGVHARVRMFVHVRKCGLMCLCISERVGGWVKV